MVMNEESTSGYEGSLEDKIDEKNKRWERPVPGGVHSDKLLDTPGVRRWNRKGMGHRNKTKPNNKRRFRRELERLERKERKKNRKKNRGPL